MVGRRCRRVHRERGGGDQVVRHRVSEEAGTRLAAAAAEFTMDEEAGTRLAAAAEFTVSEEAGTRLAAATA